MPKYALPVDFRQGDSFTAANIAKLFNYFKDCIEGTNYSSENPGQIDEDNFVKGSVTERELNTGCIDNAAYIKDNSIPYTAIDKKTIGVADLANSIISSRHITFMPILFRIWNYTGGAGTSLPPTTVYETGLNWFPSMAIFSSRYTGADRDVIITTGGYRSMGNGCKKFGDHTVLTDIVIGIVAGGVVLKNAETVLENTQTTNALVIVGAEAGEFYP